MRLLHLEIEECRSVVDGLVPLEGLVVLFGPNSGGKTTVLEAVRELLGTPGGLRRDPGSDEGDPYAAGRLWFDLPGAGLSGSVDEILMRDLLVGVYASRRKPWTWLDQDAAELLVGGSLEDVRTYLVDLLARQSGAGELDDRRRLAVAVFEAPLFGVQFGDIVLYVHPRNLDREALAAAARIASAPLIEEADTLGRVAGGLSKGHPVQVEEIGDQAYKLLRTYAPVITLDNDPERLASDIEEALPRIHDRLWALVPKPKASEADAGKGGSSDDKLPLSEVVDQFLIGNLPAKHGDLVIDPWLEALGEDPAGTRVVTPGLFGRYDIGSWYRVRRSLRAVARVLAERANQLAPSFVRDGYTISVEVLAPAVWPSAPNRVRIVVDEGSGERRDVSVVGSGVARWVAAALRLAAWELLSARRVVRGDHGREVADVEPRNALVERARLDPDNQAYLYLEPARGTLAVYLADEPEAHLHPRAVRSVLAWLQDLARSSATVIVATHHPAFLERPGEFTHLVMVTREDDVTELHHVEGGALRAVSAINNQVGLTGGELFLLTRLVLFVEGEHDRVVLEEWFGQQLSEAAVRVIPLRGIDNLVGLPLAGMIQEIGLPIAVLADDTDVPTARMGRGRTRGEKAVSQFLYQAQQAGVEVKTVGLAEPDIVYYLDDEICQRVAPKFPGWQAAATAWKLSATTEDFKRWVSGTYGLRLDRPSVQQLARTCAREGKIPDEFRGRLRSILTFASNH